MVFIFETHPVQYRAPLYQELEKLFPGQFKVYYASDCSVRGHVDPGFNKIVSWDTPLLEGYSFEILANENGVPMTSWGSLTGRGIFRLLQKERPAKILLCQFFYAYSWTVFLSAILLRIPVWIRQETQDEAFDRSRPKRLLRQLFYKLLYKFVQGAFYIGNLNREHLLRHGFKPKNIFPARYSVASPMPGWSEAEKTEKRQTLRNALGIASSEVVLGFFGKLISKKDPMLLLESFRHLDPDLQKKVRLLFVGAGELEAELKLFAEQKRIPALFPGFINQQEIPLFYLAADILILPSRRGGETWGLVVNEALHAGCGVIVSEGVGTSREFAELERFRVIPVGDAVSCAKAIAELAKWPRSFSWAEKAMHAYTIPEVARGFAPLFS